MTVSLLHAFQSAKADSADATIVRPSNWNAEHSLKLTGPALVGRTTASQGAATEITLGTGLQLIADVLSSSGSFLIDDAINNAVTNFTFTHTTTGAPAAGIGTGIAFVTETAAGNNEIGAIIAAVTTDVSAGFEDFDLRFYTMFDGAAAAERMRIDSAGHISTGGVAPVNTVFGFVPQVELNFVSGGTQALALQEWANSATASADLYFAKSRGTSVGSYAAAQSGDWLGYISFAGADGTNFEEAAAILAAVDGTPGANDMPGRLQFFTTPDGSNAVVERMRIDSAGRVGIGLTPVSNGLSVAGYSPGSGGINTNTIGYYDSGSGGINFASLAILENVNNDGYADGWYVRLARHSGGAKAIVNSGDQVGFALNMQAYDGSTYRNVANIGAFVDGTPGSGDMPGRLVFSTTPDGSSTATERMRITSAGQIVVNFNAMQSTPVTDSRFIVCTDTYGGTNGAYIDFGGYNPGTGRSSYIATENFSSGWGDGVYFKLARGTAGSKTVVASGDRIGGVTWQAYDGSAFNDLAQIEAFVDGTPGASDMPGRLTFNTTPDGSSGLVERLRIDNQGHIIALSATTTPPTLATNGQWVMTPTSNTNMRISYRGSDGTTRVADITLA